MRVATLVDVSLITTLVNRAFVVEQSFVTGDRTNPAAVADLLQKGIFYIEEDAACVYVELRPETGYFGMLAVDPSHERRGLGRKLIAAAEDYCRSAGRTLMEITVVNIREELRPFYFALGYAISGEKPFPYPARLTRDAVSLLVMTKRLLPQMNTDKIG